MRTILFSIAAVAALAACDSPDISDNDPITTPVYDAGNPAFDADVNAPDAAQTTFDANNNPTPAQAFCTRYDSLCPFGDNPNWFQDETECLAAYGTFQPSVVTCVNAALDARENGGNNATCAEATGTGC